MRTIKIDDYTVGPNDSFVFDTNVWLFLFGPMAHANSRKQRVYSSILSQILSRGAGLYITSLIVAEYINRVLHIGFEQWKMEDRENRLNAKFKESYRNTEHYTDTLESAKDQINEILKCAKKQPDNFHILDIASLLGSLNNQCDYNDAYIVQCCEKNGFKLVSDDQAMQSINSSATLLTR